MFDKKELEALQAEIAEIKEQLILSEERRNAQYSDVMLEIKKLTEGGVPLPSLEDAEYDDMYDQVKEFIIKEQMCSTSLIQRRFKVGYGRAARIMDQLQDNGVISESDGTNKPREVLIDREHASQEDEEELDKCYEEAKEYVIEMNKASTSLLQRQFGIGYGKAAKLMDQLEETGVISPSDGTNKPRKILLKENEE